MIRERERESDVVCDGRSRDAARNKGEWEITCVEVEDGRDVGQLVREGKVEGRQLCRCWARVGRVVETAARAGVGEGRLERESMTSVTYLGEKRRASDERQRQSDILPPHVTANNPQGDTDGIAAFFRSSKVKETTKMEGRREGEWREEGAAAETWDRRGPSSRGGGGYVRGARTASTGFLPLFTTVFRRSSC